MKQVLGCIRRADEKYHMIQDGDRVCIGVSGGKDSMLLLKAMGMYQRFAKTKFTLQAVMLDLGIVPQDTAPIEAFAREVGVPLEVRKTDIGDVVFNIRKETHPCALCAKLRRGALNNAAVEYGCNRVALGHNREDVLETFFLSLLYEARINTFHPITHLNRKNVTLIRPFIFLPEKHILSVVREQNIPVLPANCPVAGNTKREEMKELISHLCTLVPDIEEKLMHALANTEKYNLWDKLKCPPQMAELGEAFLQDTQETT